MAGTWLSSQTPWMNAPADVRRSGVERELAPHSRQPTSMFNSTDFDLDRPATDSYVRPGKSPQLHAGYETGGGQAHRELLRLAVADA